MSSSKPHWDSEAEHAAEQIHAELREAHRGAMVWQDPGVVVIFGNDGYGSDDRAREEVEYVRHVLSECGVTELGFGTSRVEDYTWALLVEASDVDALNEIVWTAWANVEGGYQCWYQMEIAARAIHDFSNPMKPSLN